ncbi:MAG TPA: histidine kinase [Gemmatimonas sp.]|uniref:histidine kinase n=1 Tax=Gemmatimonas sp. TaxID=1962908 RepID=UPI002EDA680A
MFVPRLRLVLIPFLLFALLIVGFVLGDAPAGARITAQGMRLESDTPDAWRTLDGKTLRTWSGPYWLRYQVQLTETDRARPLGIAMGLRGASEATWDDIPLPPNGVVGNSVATEVPGHIDWIVPVPTTRADTGAHALVIRVSSQHQSRAFSRADLAVRVQALDDLYGMRYRGWLLPSLAMGCLLVAALYVATVIARTGARQGAWVLIGLCVVGLVLPALEAWRPLVGYLYTQHLTRLLAIRLLTAASALLLPAYFALRFDARPALRSLRIERVLYVVLVVSLATFATPFDLAGWLLHASGLAMSLRITWRSARGDWSGAAGMLTVLLGTTLLAALIAPGIYIDGLYVIAFAAILITVLLTHAGFLRTGAERSVALEAARARLSTALLRGSIHPHWLMNTLMSLQELIERSPAEASRMVELLGDEFRMVRAASDEGWITVDEEVALCRTHLAIVSIGRPHPLTLRVEGEALWREHAIPPGVLHTLIENGLTHGAHTAPDSHDAFVLQAVDGGAQHLTLVMSAPGTPRAGQTISPGTGTRFIEASLRTAFHTDWQFTQAPQDDRWVSTLILPRMAMRRGFRERIERTPC